MWQAIVERRLVLRHMLDLISSFGCAAVAEGVENEAVEAVARAEGFGYLQGFHLGAPTIERAWLGELSVDIAETSSGPLRSPPADGR